jgi:hypothetical protein
MVLHGNFEGCAHSCDQLGGQFGLVRIDLPTSLVLATARRRIYSSLGIW